MGENLEKLQIKRIENLGNLFRIRIQRKNLVNSRYCYNFRYIHRNQNKISADLNKILNDE